MIAAAKYYLEYIGKRATDKQVEALIKAVGPHIIRMAMDRGWRP